MNDVALTQNCSLNSNAYTIFTILILVVIFITQIRSNNRISGSLSIKNKDYVNESNTLNSSHNVFNSENVDNLSSLTFNYFNRAFSRNSWQDLQYQLDCLSTKGLWLDTNRAYQPLCFQEPWKACTGATKLLGIKYSWVLNASESCTYKPVNLSLLGMCMLMQGRTIMIVGDSISGEFGTSFLNQMALDDPEQCDADIGFYATGMHEVRCYHLGYPNFRLNIIRNDRLSLVTKRTVTSGTQKFADFYEFPWIRDMSIAKPPIVVFNRGAHFENTTKLLSDINKAILHVTTNYPNTLIVWRNTPRGVENYNQSFSNVPLLTQPDPNRPSSLPYSYEHFNRQNEEVRRFLQSRYPQVLYWDIAFSMSLREDGHRDPLHYCFPGPMDYWPYFLFNIINMIVNSSIKS